MKHAGIKNLTGNRGSTLITVIVAIAFVTILTTIILGSSVVNVRMKSIDRLSKDKFYYAEKYLNDVYTGIGQETAVIAGEQYETAFKTLAEEAEGEYKKKFIKKTAEKLALPEWTGTHDMSAVSGILDAYVVGVSGISHTVSVKDYNYETYAGADAGPLTADRIRLIGVQVTSTDSKDFQAVISTDILIETPTMDFLGENVDVTDYCIIANKGIYIKGKATINGNVYAGLHAKTGDTTIPADVYGSGLNTVDYGEDKLYGGINIYGKASTGSDVKMNGNYIVSKGDINLSGYRPKLTIGKDSAGDANLPNVYFDTLRTCKGADLDAKKNVISLNANTFALNDLELNADKSRVVIKGNYYGYNDKTLPDESKIDRTGDPSVMKSFSGEAGHDDADSSAIIINGNSTTLDMKNVRSLVLMGRAYVDFSKGAKSGVALDGGSHVAPTAEAVALKTNQQLYLIPTDLLEGPNPATELGGSGFVLAKITDEYGNTKEKIKDWFGYDFVDTSAPFKTYKVTMSDDTEVYYAYLNFNNKLWVKEPTARFGYAEAAPSITVLGTGGSVSSMEAFFDIVMSSKEKHDKIISDAKADAIADGKSEAEADIIAKEAADTYEDSMVSPSPYRVYGRILWSMGYDYFDLHDCVIGGGAGSATIIYSQNAIVNYETEKEKNADDSIKVDADGIPIVKKDADGYPVFESKMLENNTGMERYADYPQNLFHRYQWLTTYLNAHQDVPLQEDPNDPSDDDYKSKYSPYISTVKSEWKGNNHGYIANSDAAPLSHFVAIDRIVDGLDTTSDIGKAVARGLARRGYGDCIVKKGDIVIGVNSGEVTTVGSTFKGVAIADGNIIVKAGMKVNGLLMATGVVVVEDGTKITYDKGLIQARIEKELANVRSFPDSEPTPTAGPTPTTTPAPTPTPTPEHGLKSYYLINYLVKQDRVTGETTTDAHIMYKAVEGSKKKIDRIDADYHSFMFYENWQKGPGS